ncbi:MAG: hypothetical protein JWQ40_4901 [Segetibacter sp.]|nr:hypothetical protein [Segetibacter sp.]
MFKLRWKYLVVAILLFVVEVLIAVYVNDNFVRPYFGDFLVVILIYYFIRAFLKIPVNLLAISVLLFAYLVEVLQYFKFIKLLGLQHSRLANIILGNSFQWIDIVAYTLGILFILLIEKMASGQAKKDTIERQSRAKERRDIS